MPFYRAKSQYWVGIIAICFGSVTAIWLLGCMIIKGTTNGDRFWPENPPVELVHVDRRLMRYELEGNAIEIADGRRGLLKFDKQGYFEGVDGCNRIWGHFVGEANDHFELIAELVGCGEIKRLERNEEGSFNVIEVIPYEGEGQWFQNAFTSAKRYEIVDEELHLYFSGDLYGRSEEESMQSWIQLPGGRRWYIRGNPDDLKNKMVFIQERR